MNRLFLTVMCAVLSIACQQSSTTNNTNVFTSDIDLFWTAYDSIRSTNDSLKQAHFLKTLYLDKGSPGLQKMRQARNYTEAEYLQAIQNYPLFWDAIRKNTYKAKTVGADIELGLEQLYDLYPNLKPAKIYFTIGALRSNGTTMDSTVLIGSELAFANAETPTNELPDYLSHLESFFKTNPGEHSVFLNVHEYVHTQQSTTIGYNLLAQTVLEGAAEFVAEKALETASPNPQINFGRANDAKIKAAFEQEMFSPIVYNWIWNSADNDFGIRDLAYYVGYMICKNYYHKAADKALAIQTMIELNYNNEASLIDFVEQSGYFTQPLLNYKTQFENRRPKVTHIDHIPQNATNVMPGLDILTIHFSEAMDARFRNFQLGPLGEEHLMRITDFIGFSEDAKSVSFKIQPLEANKTYQLQVGFGFRNNEGIPLIPYLIDIKTANKH